MHGMHDNFAYKDAVHLRTIKSNQFQTHFESNFKHMRNKHRVRANATQKSSKTDFGHGGVSKHGDGERV